MIRTDVSIKLIEKQLCYYHKLKTILEDYYYEIEKKQERQILKEVFISLNNWANVGFPICNNYVQTEAEHVIYIIKQNGKIISFALLAQFNNNYGKYIFYIYTFPEYRRKGYAYKILEHIKKKNINYKCQPIREEAVKLFQKFSYEISSIQYLFNFHG